MVSNSCHILTYPMTCHHICHNIIHAMSSLPFTFTEFVPPSYPWLLLNSFDITDDPCNGSFVFYCFHPASMSIGYSFVIHELLWHQWQLYSQQSPPLALMATSKHSPPLTTMTKDNLLYQFCTHFDIGFLIFLLSDNSPCHHISPLLTELGYLIHVLSFNISFAIGSWMIT